MGRGAGWWRLWDGVWLSDSVSGARDRVRHRTAEGSAVGAERPAHPGAFMPTMLFGGYLAKLITWSRTPSCMALR